MATQPYSVHFNAGIDRDFGGTLGKLIAGMTAGERLVLPEGEYHIYPHDLPERFLAPSNNRRSMKRVAMLLENLADVEIDGSGSRLIFHGEIVPVHMHQCAGVTLKNLSIDWVRPFYSQAEICGYDETGVEFQIDRGRYPCEVADGIMCFQGEDWSAPFREGVFEIDREKGAPAYLSGDNFGIRGGSFDASKIPARQTGEDRFHLTLPCKRTPSIGNILLLRHYPRLSPGIFLSQSRDVTIESVTIHHAGAMGVIAQYCENVSLLGVVVAPPDGSDRRFSVTVDATHFVNCRGLVHLRGCRFSHMMDDPCNVHGINARFAQRIDKRTAVFETVHHEQHGVPVAFAGDRVQLSSNVTLLPYAELTVSGAKAISEHLIEVTFNEALPDELGAGHVMENMTWTADLHVEDCVSGPNRARGYLVSTPGKVLLERNHITAGGAAIKISGDANFWFESGAVRDVTIRDNTIVDCCYGPKPWGSAMIDIDPEIADPQKNPAAFHRNIRILGNTFRTFDPSVLYARSVDGLCFSNNTVELTTTYPEIGRHEAVINLEACTGLDICDNVIDMRIDRKLVTHSEPR
ncbi:MAG: hypothetical protein Q7Q73_05550 [Verrucomicrobiota bacterium JB024]|nr:hypothetical protein [Verrucomicrobiota bacterium JB024]